MRARPFVILISLLVLSCTAFTAAASAAGGTTHDSILVNRTLPASGTIGEKIVVTIDITNTGSSATTVALTEHLPADAGFDTAAAVKTVVHESGTGRCLFPGCTDPAAPMTGGYEWTSYSYNWNFDLGPGGKKTLTYWVVPRAAGILGIPSAELKVNGKQYSLPAQMISIACTAGHACDPALGENAVTCPENCKASVSDTICSPVKDGACDPDCTAGYDPDCGKGGGLPVSPALLIAGLVIVAAAAGAGFWLVRKRKQ